MLVLQKRKMGSFVPLSLSHCILFFLINKVYYYFLSNIYIYIYIYILILYNVLYIYIYIYIKVVVIPKQHTGINWYINILFL